MLKHCPRQLKIGCNFARNPTVGLQNLNAIKRQVSEQLWQSELLMTWHTFHLLTHLLLQVFNQLAHANAAVFVQIQIIKVGP
jgi:hypothetical protein